jgi:predicted ATPase
VDTEPELLAQHFTAADMVEKAVPYWLAAGQKALAGSSLPEAASHLSKALESTAKIENEHDRAEHELEVRTALGAATMAIHGWPAPELRDVVLPACKLFELGHGSSDAFMNFWNLWVHHACRAEHREGLAVVDRMLKHASERNDPVMELISSFTAAMANHWVGNYDQVLAHERDALEVYDLERDRNLVWSYNHDPKNTLLSWASNRAWAMGYPDKARALSDEAVEHARKIGHPFNLCWTLGNSSKAYANCGEHDKACARVEELRRVAREQQLPFMEEYMVSIELGLTAAQVGKYQVAYDQCAHSEDIWRAVGGRFYSPTVRAYMAEACLHLGRIGEAVELVDESINRIETTGEFIFAEEIYRLAGLVYLKHSEDQDTAVTMFQKSFDYSKTHGTKSFELRTSMSLARLWREQGKRQEARDLLAPIYNWFTEGFDTADLKEAQALLKQLT